MRGAWHTWRREDVLGVVEAAVCRRLDAIDDLQAVGECVTDTMRWIKHVVPGPAAPRAGYSARHPPGKVPVEVRVRMVWVLTVN